MVPVSYDLLYIDGLVTRGRHSMVVLKVHQGCDDHLSPFDCSNCLVKTITVTTGSVIWSPKITQWTYAPMMGNGTSDWNEKCVQKCVHSMVSAATEGTDFIVSLCIQRCLQSSLSAILTGVSNKYHDIPFYDRVSFHVYHILSLPFNAWQNTFL